MLKTKIDFIGDVPYVNIDGELHSPLAYTTYFEERGQWQDFINNGYRMFFINVSFTTLPINNSSGFTPFLTGVFDGEEPDYREFDGVVRGILTLCPDALIFPRINVAMPQKWLQQHPYETVETELGARESLYSDSFKHDGTELLKELVSHIREADYAHRIASYQLCGGTTQEWMHHDLFGSYSPMGMEKFKAWAFEKYGIENITIPSREALNCTVLSDEAQKYYEFCNSESTKTIEHFARELKEFIHNEQVVGVFYGYNAYVNNCLWGLHGLRKLIGSPYIDFFSSPCCYDSNRHLGVDWGDMIPADSLKAHGKLYFVECDIRTHLTDKVQNARPGMYPEGKYLMHDANGNKTVWSGPDSLELSISALRKAFAHQLTKGNGIWWFDMWGGWYHNEAIMNELSEMKAIFDSTKEKEQGVLPSAEVVLFVDEKAYSHAHKDSPFLHTVNHHRISMSHSGIPFDTCMVEDVEIVLKHYKFAIFTTALHTESGKKALGLCERLGVPYVTPTEEKPFYDVDELRNILVSNGIHCYNTAGNVLYCGNGYIGIHKIDNSKTTITLPQKRKIRPLLDAESEFYGDSITVDEPMHSTRIFEIL